MEIQREKRQIEEEIYRHSCAHLLAHALKKLYPETKLATGPAIENGFYYDFACPQKITQKELVVIENTMKQIAAEKLVITKKNLTFSEAYSLLTERNEPYKIQILTKLKEQGIDSFSFYYQGEFVDLCSGPHVPNTDFLKNFKLTALTGAYFNKDSNSDMLTRIYGIAFVSKEDLENYEKQTQEALTRDHNKLGRSLKLFTTIGTIGKGLPLLLPEGAKLFKVLNRFIEDEEEKRGYLLTRTPYLAKSDLYKISGHWDHYQENMFILQEDENEVLALRPMTCPFQYFVYKNQLRSYQELPLRYNETAVLYRKEASGEMHGLIRMRQFTLADAHIICIPEQLENEFAQALDLIYYVLKCLGLEKDVTFRFSRRDPLNKRHKYIDNDKAWESTEALMKRILDKLALNYYEALDEAAFYGPKLDIQARNIFGKEDTLMTIQIDFAAADNFDLVYVNAQGQKVRPCVIHRSSIGCYERTMAFLIEKYNGAFPFWFAPTQISVLSVTQTTNEYAQKIITQLQNSGFRVTSNLSEIKIGAKIKEAQLAKIPYMLILGTAEEKNKAVTVRHRTRGIIGTTTLEKLITFLVQENQDKKINSDFCLN